MARPAVIAYDIADDRRRRGIHRVLQRWRLDGQKSVHECRLDAHEAIELYLQLAELICPRTDRLLLTWVQGEGPAYRWGRARRQASGLLRVFR